jgi:hypothetical protein
MSTRKGLIKFDGLEELSERLDELADGEAIKRATENALIKTDKYMTAEVEKAMPTAKAPSGKTINWNYAKGETKKSLDKDYSVDWDGNFASAKVGFKISDGGLASQFIIYGTQGGRQTYTDKNGHKVTRTVKGMKPNTQLKMAVKGEGKHKKVIQEIQLNEFKKVIDEVMGGKQ